LECIVLETDAPDISPAWAYKQRNEPGYLARIAAEFAELRGISMEAASAATTANARSVLAI
jgi:TatD DNase family protein